jgi:hypothetical protein
MRNPFWFVVTFACLLAAIDCLAQEARRQAAFKTLQADGFDIKAVTFVHENDQDYLLATMQKVKAIAVCTFSPGAWSNMDDPTLENPELCEIR